MFQFITQSPLETKEAARKLGGFLKKGDVLLFAGDLGAGKTTFIQGLIKGLGAHEEALSPTFVLIETISGRVPIHHMDFYRLTPKEVWDVGIQDYLKGQGEIEKGVLLIEWADRCKEIWPEERLEVRIKNLKGKQERGFSFQASGKRYGDILKKFKNKI